MLRVDYTTDVLLIDVSYYIIYRYHALHKWFQISETEYSEELFLSKYESLFESNLCKLMKKLRVLPHNVVLVGDCHRKNIWRMQICPDYKASRDAYWEKNPIKENIFPLIHNTIIPNLINKRRIQYISLPSLEADDIVYGLKKKLYASGFQKKMVILTNDSDYLQLIDVNVDVVNLPSMKSIRNRSLGCPRKDVLLKIMGGDPSDNIPRAVTKAKLMRFLKNEAQPVDDDAVRQFVNENGNLEQFEKNRVLIQMENVPDDLLDKIVIEEYTDSL